MFVKAVKESDLGKISTLPHAISNMSKLIFPIYKGLSNQNRNISYVSAIKPKIISNPVTFIFSSDFTINIIVKSKTKQKSALEQNKSRLFCMLPCKCCIPLHGFQNCFNIVIL